MLSFVWRPLTIVALFLSLLAGINSSPVSAADCDSRGEGSGHQTVDCYDPIDVEVEPEPDPEEEEPPEDDDNS